MSVGVVAVSRWLANIATTQVANQWNLSHSIYQRWIHQPAFQSMPNANGCSSVTEIGNQGADLRNGSDIHAGSVCGEAKSGSHHTS